MQTALDFLRTHNEVAFATCEGNLPRLRVFQIMKVEGNRLYFATSPKKGVWRQLQENTNIEILATDNRISVRCAGMVQFDVPDAVQREIYEANPVLPRLYAHYTDLVYFVLPIAELDYYDLGPTPPIFKHFDLITGETGNGFVGERFAK